MGLFMLFSFIVAPLTVLDFLVFLISGESFFTYAFKKIFSIYIVFFVPFVFLLDFDYKVANDCCSESAVFSPAHRLSMYVLVALCALAYFYSFYRKKVLPPLLELINNALLVIGIILNILIAYHVDATYWVVGNVPIIIFFLYRLIDNHKFLTAYIEEHMQEETKSSTIFHLLQMPLFKRLPVLLVVAVPVLVLLACLLMIAGQKPDAFILAFTETYRHGLSQLDCSNVTCPDGHFLCTIAASGHQQFVKPERVGIRYNRQIKVNRQLLVSNAFEDMLADRWPTVHKYIRIAYNFIGGNCKKLYDVLGNKWLADFVYVLMKPLEWMFVVNLYLFDRKPENRIAKQYLHHTDRTMIDSRYKN